MSRLDEAVSMVETAFTALEGARYDNAAHRQADAIRGIGYALAAYVMLQIHKQKRREVRGQAE